MTRRLLARISVYGGLCLGFGVMAFDLLNYVIWDGSQTVPVRVIAPTPIRLIVQSRWGFDQNQDAVNAMASPPEAWFGMLAHAKRTTDGCNLNIPVSGRASGLGLSSDTFQYSPYWVIFVQLEDQTTWAAVVTLPPDLQSDPTPELIVTIPEMATQLPPGFFNPIQDEVPAL